ncbi:hypothetical protein PR002_g25437 [Phytophthora rubi]|uniref:Uncharacterized protein n=1 Tax=Phytophthora rubi TaxID=129364 RepID=A0A6A3HZC7_9STRA|nr:hypothetical protein PR002_g25437 [Phytophthora rubi]
MPGSHNDINVLERSDRFSDIANLRALRCNYDINDTRSQRDTIFQTGFTRRGQSSFSRYKLPWTKRGCISPASKWPRGRTSSALSACFKRNRLSLKGLLEAGDMPTCTRS